MDPLSTSIGLLASVAQLSVYITKFVRGVRDARQDMDAVSRELKSLELCLETLRDDCMDPKLQYPARAKQMLLAIMQDCDQVTHEMLALLTKMSNDSLGAKVRWTTGASSDMNKLRSSLAAHKSAIDIALEMWTLSIASATKEDTTILRRCTDDIKQDTSALLEEVQMLRLQVEGLERNGSTRNLNKFLDVTEEYAGSIAEKEEHAVVEVEDRNGDIEAIDEESSSTVNDVWVGVATSTTAASDRTDSTEMHSNWGGMFDGLDKVPRNVPSLVTSYKRQAEAPISETTTAVELEKEALYNQDSWITRQLIVDDKTPPGNLIASGINKQNDFSHSLPEVYPRQQLPDDSDKEVVTVSDSSRNPNTFIGLTPDSFLPEVSHRQQQRPVRLDEVAIAASTKARGRLKDLEKSQLDRDLLRRTKEKADVTKIRLLLDRGANPDASGPRNTVLTTEIQYGGRSQVIKLLLQRGANPNATTDGVPAYEILEGGNMDRAKSLFRVGTSVDAVPNRVGTLFLAAVHGDIDLVNLLLDYNATINPNLEPRPTLPRNLSNESSSRSPSTGARRGSVINRQSGSHKSALLAAAEAQKWDVVQLLCDQGADPNVQGGKYDTTLQIAASHNKKDLLQRLLDRGADPTAQGGYYGSPLIAAAAEGHVGATKLLLDRGAASAINTRGPSFGTALAAATLRGHLRVVNLLLERGADTKVDSVLDIALQCVKDDPEARDRTAIVRSLEGRGARQAVAAPKAPEWAGLF